jgi:hypothetical protein
MALSNPITWANLCTEFSLNPLTAVFPASFYGKGGAPASGTLGFQDFVGRSGGGSYTPTPGTYSYTDNGLTNGNPGSSVTVTSISGSVAWTWSFTGSVQSFGQHYKRQQRRLYCVQLARCRWHCKSLCDRCHAYARRQFVDAEPVFDRPRFTGRRFVRGLRYACPYGGRYRKAGGPAASR